MTEPPLVHIIDDDEVVRSGGYIGTSNHQIARELVLSAHTVAGHRASIVSKLDASSLSDVIRKSLIAEVRGVFAPTTHKNVRRLF
jgi:FixJ family two-component response regulator